MTIGITIKNWSEATSQAEGDLAVVSSMYPEHVVTVTIGDVETVECEERAIVIRLMSFLFDVGVSCRY